MSPGDQALPRQRGRTRRTIEDLLMDTATSTALEAAEVGDLDEARRILETTDQLIGGRELAADHTVAVLAARHRTPGNEGETSGSVIQLR